MKDISIQRFVIVQVSTAFILAVAMTGFGWIAAVSTLLGGVSVALPSGYMAWRIQKPSAQPAVALMRLLSAELGKWLLTGLMIGAVYVWVEPLNLGFFILGLVTTYIGGLVLFFILSSRGQVKTTE